MSTRNLPTRTANSVVPQPVRVIHYVDPAPRADLVAYSAAQIAARREEQQLMYARWQQRQAVQAERDRKARRFFLGFGAVVGVAVLAGCSVAGWLVYRAVTGIGVGSIAAVVVGVLALAGLLAGGRRCVTIVQHWH
jgi:hypothetical protein